MATIGTTAGAWFVSFTDERRPFGERAVDAALFSCCALLILGAHEMGHYLLARHHRVASTLPYFIPFPFGFGTLGAVIRLKGRIPDRDALVDIGAAGPLAGLVVAIPLYAVGLSLSKVVAIPPPSGHFAGPMSVWGLVAKLFQGGPWEVGASMFFGDNLLTLGLLKLVRGELPPGHDLLMNPVLTAAWFGLVVTMLNLMPLGQLDAGHLTHAWFGEKAVPLGKAVAVGLVLLVVFFSAGWVLWLVLTTKVIGFKHPEVILPEEPLSAGRKVVCAVCFLCFVVTLMPVPVGVVW